MAQSACFVAELDFTIPKVIVDKAHQILSRNPQEISSISVTSPRSTTQPVTPGRTKGEKLNHPRAEERHTAGRSQTPSLPGPTDGLRCFTPALKVKGLLKSYDIQKRAVTAMARAASPVSTVRMDLCENTFEVQGMQLLDEPSWGVLTGDINLKGLACNHAHDFLVPRSVDPTFQPAVTAAPRKERILKAASLGEPGSYKTPSVMAGQAAAPRSCHTSHRRKPVQMFGWDDTERGQIGALPAFFEGGVNSTDAVVTPAGSETPPEICDYVGQV